MVRLGVVLLLCSVAAVLGIPDVQETTTSTAHLDEVTEREFIDTSSSTTPPVDPESSTPKAEEPTTLKQPSPETGLVDAEATTPEAEEPTTPEKEPMPNAPLPQPGLTPLPSMPSKPSQQPPGSVHPPQPLPTGFPTFPWNLPSSASYFPGASHFPSNTPSGIPGYDAFLPTFSGMPYPFPVNQMNPTYPYQPPYSPAPYPYLVPPGYAPYPTPPAQSTAYPTNSLTSPAFLIYNPQLGYVNPYTGAVVVPITPPTATATAASQIPNKSNTEKPSAELLPPKAEGESATKEEKSSPESIWAAKRKLLDSSARRVKESKEGLLKFFDAVSQHAHETVEYKTKLLKKPFEFVRDQAEALLQSHGQTN